VIHIHKWDRYFWSHLAAGAYYRKQLHKKQYTNVLNKNKKH